MPGGEAAQHAKTMLRLLTLRWLASLLVTVLVLGCAIGIAVLDRCYVDDTTRAVWAGCLLGVMVVVLAMGVSDGNASKREATPPRGT